MKVVRLSDLHTSHLYPPGNIPVTHFFSGWVNPRAKVRPEGLCQWKIPLTPSGIKPTTFQLVSQCFNQLCHCAPPTTTGVRVNKNQNLTVRASRVTSNTTKSQEIYQRSCISRTQQRIRNLKQTLQHRHTATSGHCHVMNTLWLAMLSCATDVAHYTTVPVNISMSEQHTQSNGCMTIRMCVIWTPVTDHDLQSMLQT